MEVRVEDLVNRVKTNMEELTDSQVSTVELTVGVDVDAYIRAKLPDAVLAVWSKMPSSLLPCADCAFDLDPIIREDGSGMVLLPNDVWRMVEFRMKGWKRSVTRFLEETSPEYELQYNPYTRGGRSTPVCALITLEYCKCLEYYALPNSDVEPCVEVALYVPYPRESRGAYNIPDEVIPAVCYTCASMVYEILGQPELAVAMLRGIV